MKKSDINFVLDNIKVNCRAVGIIANNDMILMQKRQRDNFWTLPGGKIALLEKGEETIQRELKEEIGIDFENCTMYNVKENFFKFENQQYHEFIFMYLINPNQVTGLCIDKEFDGIETQKKLQFRWMTEKELLSTEIAPTWLKDELLTYLNADFKGKTKMLGRKL